MEHQTNRTRYIWITVGLIALAAIALFVILYGGGGGGGGAPGGY